MWSGVNVEEETKNDLNFCRQIGISETRFFTLMLVMRGKCRLLNDQSRLHTFVITTNQCAMLEMVNPDLATVMSRARALVSSVAVLVFAANPAE